jgi:anti-sigma-K factor RskA
MAYADGALDPAEREAVEAIIERHPECRQKVEKYRATLAPLQSLFRETISIDHLAPLIERIRLLKYDLCMLTGDYRAPTFGPLRSPD